jgi:hypothetical protein
MRNVTRCWRTLYCEKLCNWYSLQDIFIVSNWKRKRCTGHAACMGEIRYAYWILTKKPDRKVYFGKCSFLTLFILVRHTSKLNYRIIINTVQCDLICRYLLPLYVSVSWSSSEGIRSTWSTLPQNTANRKRLDITTIQNYNRLKKWASLRGPRRTPNNTPAFRFNRRGARTQTISFQDLNY